MPRVHPVGAPGGEETKAENDAESWYDQFLKRSGALVIVLLASTGGVNPGASLWLLPREDDGDEDVRSGGGNTTSVFAGQGGNGTFWWLP
jgi:hypothetical protein